MCLSTDILCGTWHFRDNNIAIQINMAFGGIRSVCGRQIEVG